MKQIEKSNWIEKSEVMEMNKKKKTSLAVVIINCFCAVVWNLLFFIKLADGYSDTAFLVIYLLCAITWTLCAIMHGIQYAKQRKNKEFEHNNEAIADDGEI